MTLLSASLLAAHPLRLEQELQSISGIVQNLHLDVMDGHAVPNLGLSLETIRALPADWGKDVHLMVTNPVDIISWLHDVAIDIYYVSADHWPTIYNAKIDQSKLGLVLNPQHEISKYVSLLKAASHILVMGVVPGWSGQQMRSETIEKVRQIKALNPQAQIGVDGGVNDKNAASLIEAGANQLIIGSYLFGTKDRLTAVQNLVKVVSYEN